ncbi:hypothetical protein FEE95_13650 [Maribacter algarum]|uniref:Uncharacterized protein n=1 Tax=Maribacter algarum (ex Zhang et al. 2020) TaxID=2578118 RepID=A0A5S3PS82_9FLAO|nr:hypothetical protein [Maribacter algarum]TMM57521.1 hypothetical protein FEE95_13650 [Maribacter algarum]
MNRKTFIKKAAGTVLVAVPAYSLIGCSNDDSTDVAPIEDPTATDCLANGANATAISSNHGHTLTVSKADIDAGTEKSYSIQGSSGHNHTIVVTAANFTTLKSSKTIQIESSRDSSHRHDVTVSCA